MISATIMDKDMRELIRAPIRSHNPVIIRRKVRELMREYPAADWIELFYHDDTRLVSCQIDRLFERSEQLLLR